MIGAVESMPHLAAWAPKSPRTERSCWATKAGGRFSTPWTPSEFCAVTAVSTDMPNTRNAENVLRSAWMPAPPPESEPAMVRAFAISMGPQYTGSEDPRIGAAGRTPPVLSLAPAAPRRLLDREVGVGDDAGAAVDRQDVLRARRERDDQIHLGPEQRIAPRRRQRLPPREAPVRRPRDVHEH